MDSFEWNKIIGAVLGTVLLVLVVRTLDGALMETPEPAKPGYVVAGVPDESAAKTAGAPAAAAAEAPPDWGTVLASASVSDGEKISARCGQCHTLDKGGATKIGPNLWGIVDRARASVAGFSYSSAMSSDHAPWSYDKLFTYLKLPAAMVPGTKMSFAGLQSAQDRINLIAYLRTLSDSPAAIPAPAAKAAAPTPAATAPAPAPAASATTTAAAGTSPAAAKPPAAAATPAAAPSDGLDLAHADTAHGKEVSARCQQCHSLAKGGPNMIGPNLWGVVNRPRASVATFSYSSAMSSNHEPWSFEKLFTYLKQPQLMVPGTKMSFAGLSSTKDRNDLIAYLRTQSDKPAPLP
jgi:cytochrome c